ncbi:25950_t:CDS:1, partial [Dentiscutata erythropus]
MVPERSTKKIKSKPAAIFKKSWVYLSVIGLNPINFNINNSSIKNGNEADNAPNQIRIETPINTENNNSNIRSTCNPSPLPVKRVYSFSEQEQGAVVETFLTITEKAIYNFLVRNENKIPKTIVEKFAAKQTPPISNDFWDADL